MFPRNQCCKRPISVLQRSRVGGDLVLVFGQLHLVRGEGPAAVRIAVHFDDGALEAEVIGHLVDAKVMKGQGRIIIGILLRNLDDDDDDEDDDDDNDSGGLQIIRIHFDSMLIQTLPSLRGWFQNNQPD